MHGVGTNPVARVLDRGVLGEEADRGLRGPVGGPALAPDQGGRRADVDDGPAPAAPHHRDRMLASEEGPAGVDGHDAIPVRDVLRCHRRALVDGGIVHQHVQPSEALPGDRDGVHPVRLAGDVQADEGGTSLPRCQLGDALIAFGFQDIADEHAGAFPSEEPRDRRPEAGGTRGPGDQRDFPG